MSFFSQYIYSQDGDVTRQGAYVQPSLKIPTSWSFLSAFEFLYRYNWLDVKAENLADNISTSSFTWDRETHSAAVNIEIYKGATWRNEYHFNMETTGGSPASIDNDEFISQLEINF